MVTLFAACWWKGQFAQGLISLFLYYLFFASGHRIHSLFGIPQLQKKATALPNKKPHNNKSGK